MQKYYFKGLDCPDCANKLEAELNKQSYVKAAQVSFNTNTLYLDCQDFSKVLELIKRLEPEMEILQEKAQEDAPLSVYPLLSCIVLFVLSVGVLHFATSPLLRGLSYALLAGVYLFAGKDVFLGAFNSLKNKRFFDENTLMLSATIAAFCVGAYEESVSVMVFFSAGEFLQSLAIKRSKKSLQALLDVAPNLAFVKTEEGLKQVHPEELKIGDIVVVKVGEKIPTDGVVLSGESLLDQKPLTGESIPVNVRENSPVLGGSINLKAVLEVQVSKTYSDSSVAKIVDLVSNAVSQKSQTEKLITTFAKYYTPAVFFIALAIATLPPLLGHGSFSEWVYRGLIALMVSCPCALVISIPLGYFGGVGAASRLGVLVKSVHTLETLTKVKNIAFDKTGTLSKGEFEVIEVVNQPEFSQEDVLRFASCAQILSTHPIAKSIQKACQNLCEHNIQEFNEIGGMGVQAKCHANLIVAGNDQILHKYDIPHPRCSLEGTIVHVATNGTYVGYIVVADSLKEDAKKSLKALKKEGLEHFCILSGDNEHATKSVAKALDCTYHAGLLPEQKVAAFESFKAQHKGLSAFVGDGINDAPTLAMADVGVGMGSASQVSKESADIVITNNALSSIVQVFKIAHKTRRIVIENIVFALGVKALFLVLGVAGEASLWEAVFGDVGVTLVALANSMRTMRIR
ncbi:Lead, cadmium, zinc and mercury transporting ATPase; Copper-translocating P-type ATPase [Helicobacter heilmannii]|uniref:heavy metal translocating P-type ATPase n=1 Tax=Helicobacter heilmannii TaxID=35817 RepID=UPI0006A0CE7B|nr:heavy metal translocating P-type ATPase [Helicobacter heilmannii]CRF48662.1 Lead, cadmium, zinc and mercury transporting ATPase; Copper-translocating P-type ATPase [Helicobacter heilmannii]